MKQIKSILCVIGAFASIAPVQLDAGCSQNSAVTCGVTGSGTEVRICSVVSYNGSDYVNLTQECSYIETPGSVDNCIASSGGNRDQVCAPAEQAKCYSTRTPVGSCCAGTYLSGPWVQPYPVTRALWSGTSCPSGSGK
jgi:hypothetical protein